MTKVIINAFDQDHVRTNGSFTMVYNNNTSARFNGTQSNTTGVADQDAWYFERYFPKSGTYKVRYSHHDGLSNRGIANIGIDSLPTALFVVDNYAVADSNKIDETTYAISRGYHKITFKVNGKNASSTNYIIATGFIEFELIDEHPVLGESGIAQINQGSMVLLARHKAELAESTKTLNFSNVHSDKYSRILIIVKGKATASLSMGMKLNAQGANYFRQGARALTTGLAGFTSSTDTVLLFASSVILTGATKFACEVTIEPDDTGVWSMGKSFSRAFGIGNEDLGWSQDSQTLKIIDSLQFLTSTSTWAAGTTIEVYGIRK